MTDAFGKKASVLGRVQRSLLLLASLCFGLSASAQESNHHNKPTLVIGELIGRVDFRQMTIPTRYGTVLVFGTGNGKPFKVVTHNPTRLELEFYPSVLRKPGNPERIVYKFYENERALISALILDEVDFAMLENERSALEVTQSNPRFLPLPVLMPKNHVKLVIYNHRNPVLASRNVRQALSYAIDHRAVIRRLMDGKANLALGPFDNDSPLYNSHMESYKHSPRKAMQLLTEAGWRHQDGDGILDKNGKKLSFTLFYQKGLFLDAAVARQIKINLLEIGVEVNPKPLTLSEINDRLATHDFDAVLTQHTFAENIEALQAFFGRNGALNYMGYTSKTFEYYAKFFLETGNPQQKRTLIKSMQRVINQDQPVTFLYFKWWTHYLINTEKLANYRDLKDVKGRILPFDEWIIKTSGPGEDE